MSIMIVLIIVVLVAVVGVTLFMTSGKKPVDCQVSNWSNTDSCSVKCGGGSVNQVRTITIQPSNGGKSCPVLSETIPCNTQPCPINCSVCAYFNIIF